MKSELGVKVILGRENRIQASCADEQNAVKSCGFGAGKKYEYDPFSAIRTTFSIISYHEYASKLIVTWKHQKTAPRWKRSLSRGDLPHLR